MPDRLLNVPAVLEAAVSDVVSVFDAFDVGIYCVDLDGIFTYVNRQARHSWAGTPRSCLAAAHTT